MRRAYQALFVGLFLMGAPAGAAGSAHAIPSLSDTYNIQTDHAFRMGMQMRLAWTGDYAGPLTGRIDARSLRAIRDFQARHGMQADGVIGEAMLRLLVASSDRAEAEAGFTMVDDAFTGIRVGIPAAVVRDFGASDVGRVWRSEDSRIEIETVRLVGEGRTLAGLHAILKKPTAVRSVLAEEFADGFFTISGVESGRSYMMRFTAQGSDIRGLTISYAPEWAGQMARVATVAAGMFDPFGTKGSTLVAGDETTSFGRIAEAMGPQGSESLLAAGTMTDGDLTPAVGGPGMVADGARDSSGSGFVVSRDGWVLTNAHVAGACKTVLVGSHGPADEILLDEANDLALVHVAGALGEPLAFSSRGPRLGEDVLALGYPLRSILADSLNVTRGNISSLLGLMNDPRYLQISAPIQPGNSGGPLIDLAGRVVGVVTAKLNAVAIADVTGDIPQSINFAIRPEAATQFLEASGVDYVSADPSRAFASVADTTADVEAAVLPVLCLGER